MKAKNADQIFKYDFQKIHNYDFHLCFLANNKIS